MPKIDSYLIKTLPLTAQDKWIGTDSSGITTKNFTPQSVGEFININDIVTVAGQNMFYWQNAAGSRKNGSLSFPGFGGGGSNLADLTSFMISKNNIANNSVENYLLTLVGKEIILVESGTPDNYVIATLDALVENTGASNFYDAAITVIEANGTITPEGRYGLSSNSGATTGGGGGTTQNLQQVLAEGNTAAINMILGNNGSTTAPGGAFLYIDATSTSTSSTIGTYLNQKRIAPSDTTAYDYGLFNALEIEGAFSDSYAIASFSRMRYTGSGGITGYGTAALTRAYFEGTGSSGTPGLYGTKTDVYFQDTGSTGQIDYMIANNIKSHMSSTTGTVQYLQGQHTSVALNGGDITGSLILEILDFDYTGGTISGDYAALQIQADNYDYDAFVSGTARAINSQSALPSYFAGDIGLGVADPSEKLDVLGRLKLDSGVYNSIYSGSSIVASNQFIVSTNSYMRFNSQGNIDLNANVDIRFSDNSGNELMRLDTNGTNKGYLGIGTTSPIAKLHVDGGVARFSNSSSNYLEIDGSDSANNAIISNRFNSLVLKTNAGVGDPHIILLPDTGGNVGIGLTSPEENIHASGVIRANDQFLVLGGAASKNTTDIIQLQLRQDARGAGDEFAANSKSAFIWKDWKTTSADSLHDNIYSISRNYTDAVNVAQHRGILNYLKENGPGMANKIVGIQNEFHLDPTGVSPSTEYMLGTWNFMQTANAGANNWTIDLWAGVKNQLQVSDFDLTVTDLYGSQTTLFHNGGTVTNFKGVSVETDTEQGGFTSGTIHNYSGLYSQLNPTSAADITGTLHLLTLEYIDGTNTGITADPYAIYSSGDIPSYFAGRLNTDNGLLITKGGATASGWMDSLGVVLETAVEGTATSSQVGYRFSSKIATASGSALYGGYTYTEENGTNAGSSFYGVWDDARQLGTKLSSGVNIGRFNQYIVETTGTSSGATAINFNQYTKFDSSGTTTISDAMGVYNEMDVQSSATTYGQLYGSFTEMHLSAGTATDTFGHLIELQLSGDFSSTSKTRVLDLRITGTTTGTLANPYMIYAEQDYPSYFRGALELGDAPGSALKITGIGNSVIFGDSNTIANSLGYQEANLIISGNAADGWSGNSMPNGGAANFILGELNVINATSTAFGAYNTLLGWSNSVTDTFSSLVAGTRNSAAGNYQFTLGSNNDVSGGLWFGHAYGTALTVNQAGMVAVGVANTVRTPNSSTSATSNVRFVVGAGTVTGVSSSTGVATVGTRKDGFVVLADGTVTADSLTTATIESEATGKVLLTKEYSVAGYTYATLPTGVTGRRTYITDSTVVASGNFGAAVTVGGGANTVPVFYDGTNWIIA